MPKPFSLQSPEDIAKEYGGNKQKIAQAMQMGVVDPTAGTLAGMFIDRMRGAQMQEMAQTPTVAQQVFAPPQPPMGAPPMGGMPPAPPMGAPPAPPMGAPPMGGMPPAPPMGAPPMGAPPMGAPPMGMAEGGLAALPVPDMMFDEPADGSYASGGIVAFAGAGPVGMSVAPDDEEMEVVGRREPDQLYGFFRNAEDERAKIDSMYKPERAASNALSDFFGDVLSPEGQKKRRDEDKWFALAQLGATMASTPGSLLQAASAGMKSALPGLQASAKERRAEQREAIVARAQQEGLNNKESLDLAKLTMEGTNKFGEFDSKRLDREDRARLEMYGQRMANYRAQIAADADRYRADQAGTVQADYFAKETGRLAHEVAGKVVATLPELRRITGNKVGDAYNKYLMAVKSGNKKAAEKAWANVQDVEATYVQSQVALATRAGIEAGGLSPTPGMTGGRTPSPPRNFVLD